MPKTKDNGITNNYLSIMLIKLDITDATSRQCLQSDSWRTDDCHAKGSTCKKGAQDMLRDVTENKTKHTCCIHFHLQILKSIFRIVLTVLLAIYPVQYQYQDLLLAIYPVQYQYRDLFLSV